MFFKFGIKMYSILEKDFFLFEIINEIIIISEFMINIFVN